MKSRVLYVHHACKEAWHVLTAFGNWERKSGFGTLHVFSITSRVPWVSSLYYPQFKFVVQECNSIQKSQEVQLTNFFSRWRITVVEHSPWEKAKLNLITYNIKPYMCGFTKSLKVGYLRWTFSFSSKECRMANFETFYARKNSILLSKTFIAAERSEGFEKEKWHLNKLWDVLGKALQSPKQQNMS